MGNTSTAKDFIKLDYDSAFEKCTDKMKYDQSYDWDSFAKDFLGLKAIPVNGPQKDRAFYIDVRCVYKNLINNRATKYNKDWQLRVIEHGKRIMKVKKENSRRATFHHIKKMINSCNNAIKEAQAIIDNPNMDQNQKDLMQNILGLQLGYKMASRGMIQANRKMDKGIRQELLALPEWED
jgi:hypothetical protein